MKEDTLNILLSGNANAEYILPTVINSVCENTRRRVHARVICDGWARENIITPKLKVEFIQFRSKNQGRRSFCASINSRTVYLSRIKDWRRCLLMGWDNLVIGNLDELYDTEFVGSEVMTASKSDKSLAEIKWNNQTLHGVLPDKVLHEEKSFPMGGNVLDIERCHQFGVFDGIEQKIDAVNGHDHFALLLIFTGHLKRVGGKWNRLLFGQTKEVQPDDRLVHYNGARKPWSVKGKGSLWRNRFKTWDDISGKPNYDDQKLFFTLSTPRSGSTLLMRLLNVCKTSNGAPVRANGESKVWGKFIDLKNALESAVTKSVDTASLNKQGRFPCHYSGGRLGIVRDSLLGVLRALCGASKGEAIAFKEVNYAVKGSDYPKWVLRELGSLTVDMKVITLTRDPEEVQRSMSARKGWWEEGRFTLEAIKTQIQNLKALPSDLELTYKDLLNYEVFSRKIEQVGLQISREAYEKVITVKLSH